MEQIKKSSLFNASCMALAVTANDLVINGNAVDLTGDVTINDVISSINLVSSDSGPYISPESLRISQMPSVPIKMICPG